MPSVTSWRRSRLTEALADLIVGPCIQSRVPGSLLRGRSLQAVHLLTSQQDQDQYDFSATTRFQEPISGAVHLEFVVAGGGGVVEVKGIVQALRMT